MLLRHGWSRSVLLLGGVAVKVPSFRGWRRALFGVLSNLAERERRHLPGACPILWADPLGLIVVMRRTRPIDVTTPIPIHVWDLAGYDRKSSSFGILPDGAVVCTDYHGNVLPLRVPDLEAIP